MEGVAAYGHAPEINMEEIPIRLKVEGDYSHFAVAKVGWWAIFI